MNINSISDFRRAVKHKYAWPGGYPTYFLCSDGAALCHSCVKKERRNIINSVANQLRDGWNIVALDINWEDSELYCDHCSEHIESAYGN